MEDPRQFDVIVLRAGPVAIRLMLVVAGLVLEVAGDSALLLSEMERLDDPYRLSGQPE